MLTGDIVASRCPCRARVVPSASEVIALPAVGPASAECQHVCWYGWQHRWHDVQ